MNDNRSLREFAIPVFMLIYVALAFTVASPWLLLNWVLTKIFPRLRVDQNERLIAAKWFTATVRIRRGHGSWYKELCEIPPGTVWSSYQDFLPWWPVYDLRPVDMLGNTHVSMSAERESLDYFKEGEIRLWPIQLLTGRMTKIKRGTPNQAL